MSSDRVRCIQVPRRLCDRGTEFMLVPIEDPIAAVGSLSTLFHEWLGEMATGISLDDDVTVIETVQLSIVDVPRATFDHWGDAARLAAIAADAVDEE